MKTKKENLEYLSVLLSDIIENHSFKQIHSPIIKTKLTQNEKIKFALDYYDLLGPISIVQILNENAKNNPRLKRLIIEFCARYNLLKPYPNSDYEYLKHISKINLMDQRVKSFSPKSITHEYNYQNWLEIFDENKVFEESKAIHPSYHIFLDKNGNQVKFDKEKSSRVKLIIAENDIIPARCIVEGGYKYEAQEQLPEYINYIKSLRRK